MATLYKDLGKNSSDVLTKSLPSTGKVTVKTSPKKEGGASFETTVELKDGKYPSTFKITKRNVLKRELDVTGTISSRDRYSLEVVSTGLAKGVKATVKSSCSDKKEVALNVEYKNDKVGLTADVDKEIGQGPVRVKSTATFARGAYLFGASADYSVGESQPSATAVGVAYNNNGLEVAGFLNKAYGKSNGLVVTENASYKYNADTTVAAGASYNVDSGAVAVSTACQHRLNPNTTVKGRITSDGSLGLGLTHSVSSNLKLTLATDIDLNSGTARKTGFEVNFDF